jgi:hypothetical protein
VLWLEKMQESGEMSWHAKISVAARSRTKTETTRRAVEKSAIWIYTPIYCYTRVQCTSIPETVAWTGGRSDYRQPLRELSQIVSNLISHPTKNCESFLLGTQDDRGIFKVAMDGDRFARKDRAAFLGVVAHSEDIFELLTREFIYAL